MITFTLTDEQEEKFNKWRKERTLTSTIGGAYTFCFTPTGVGTIITINCADDTELNLTDYNSF